MAVIREVNDKRIFDSDCDVIVNTVNCQGVMGRGIALEFKFRYPGMFNQYKVQCEQGEVRLGKLFLYRNKKKPWILNFPTKDHWKLPSRVEYLEKGLKEFSRTYRQNQIRSVAFPKLGTTSGKLNWEMVKNLMYSHLKPLPDLAVEIYHFNHQAPDNLFNKLTPLVMDLYPENRLKIPGLMARQLSELHEAIQQGLVQSMLDVQSIPGFGEKRVMAVYDFATHTDLHDSTLESGQLELF